VGVTFQGSVIFVKDIKVSRIFYEELLGQKIMVDFGPVVGFEGGFSIWQVDRAYTILFDTKVNYPAVLGYRNLELCFEDSEIQTIWERISSKNIKLVHPLREQPWGQLVFRIYDPDEHIVEIGEPIPVFVSRFLVQGMSVEEVAERTSLPKQAIEEIAKSLNQK
jgi:catechol 2,3-dioxygenase-like lactoylglutathione lyase family enzyme